MNQNEEKENQKESRKLMLLQAIHARTADWHIKESRYHDLLRRLNEDFDPPLTDDEISEIADLSLNDLLDLIREYSNSDKKSTPNYPWTDLGNSERFVDSFGKKMRYCHTHKKWFVYDGIRWKKDRRGKIFEYAKKTIVAMYGELSNFEDNERQEKFLKFILSSQREPRVKAMVSMTQSDEGIAIVPEDLDKDSLLLNVKNGTFNLESFSLCAHSPEHYITKLAAVDYNADAKCERWLQFLDEIFSGNEHLIKFLQKAVGYSLSDSISEQVIFILYGSGENGKSTFITTIKELLGDYALQTPMSTFLVKQNDNAIPNDVAKLKGARFVSAIEADEGKKLSEALVKQLTGKDYVSARFLYGEFFDFFPRCKIFLAVNHRPEIKGTDHAIWRRIRLISFNVAFSDAKQDKELGEKLKKEFPGILNWAIEGYKLWKEEGLGHPNEIQEATQSYRDEMDVLGNYLDQCCEVKKSNFIASKNLYRHFKDWTEKNGEYTMSHRKFSLELQNKGLRKEHTRAGEKWMGVDLLFVEKNF